MTPDAATPAPPARALDGRGWAMAFAAFLAAGGAVVWLARGALRDPGLEVLTLLLLYLSLACTFCPLPTAWIVLWAARETGALPVALVATAGTCVANLHDWYIVRGLWHHRRLAPLREGPAHARAVAWFRRAPFLSLAAASFVPLPVDAVRLLAASAGYPRRSYLLASFAGRFPRYLLLAVLGHELRPSNGAILAFVVVLGALALARAALRRRRTQRGEDPEARP